MPLPAKILHRLSDPVFYRKRGRDLLRRFRSFDDHPKIESVDELGDVKKVVVVVAHPDDETFCSGLICEFRDRGIQVQLLCLTRGEGGPTGGASREELGLIRAAEMEQACRSLGIESLVFLDHVDPIGGKYRVFAPDVSAARLGEQIAPLVQDADLILSHGSNGEYWHPGHLLVHAAIYELLKDRPGDEGPCWMCFLARDSEYPIPRLVNWDDPVYLRIDTSAHSVRRALALEHHSSQLGLFGRFARGDYHDFIRKTAIESYSLMRRGALQIPKSGDESECEGNHGCHADGEVPE
ncbi:MAG: hypothetical protein CMO55_26630 [Verrucomicrobiales bacterium]|nr:hypothetical protein [Verrucomicrobiales bacterium]